MELIILGLKRKNDGEYFIYDVGYSAKKNTKKHTPIALNETITIPALSPFPFKDFTSLDSDYINPKKYDKCYLKVEAKLTEEEYSEMNHSSYPTYRFSDKEITLIGEFEDVFQYAYQKLNELGDKLGTYDLTTWTIHKETKNEDEYEAMKKILFESVKDKKNNNLYPLDIRLNIYTAVYASYLRELSEAGYKIKLNYNGYKPVGVNDLSSFSFDGDTFAYLLKELQLYTLPLLDHPTFTKDFYYNYVLGKKFEGEMLNCLDMKTLPKLLSKGIDVDDIYNSFFNFRKKSFEPQWYGYNSLEEMFGDENFPIAIEYHSPYDTYCCEDCDGYDIREIYSEDELAGEDVEVDDRFDLLMKFLYYWDNYLTKKSYWLFDFVSDNVLRGYQSFSPFLKSMYEYRTSGEKKNLN